MGPISSVSQQQPAASTVSTRVDQSNEQFRETQGKRERFDLTQPQGTQTSRSQGSETRNLRVVEQDDGTDDAEMQDLAKANTTRTTQSGSRRGSLVDLSV